MTHPYQVMGTSVPALLGRKRLLEQLDRHLLKPSPDHVQVVGPSLYGKTVLLNQLAANHRSGSSHYLTAAYVDLRHAPPATDGDFRQRFAAVVKDSLTKAGSPHSEYIELADASLYEMLVFVFDELDKENKRLLVVLDGFDHVLAGTGLTRNLWDQLRSLAQKKSLRLVTGSRRPLRELCKTDDSRTSDFWEIFYDTPISVSAFGEADWDDLVAPLTAAGVVADASARKEVVNWSGGIPVLAIALLGKLAETIKPGAKCSKPDVDGVGATALEERRQLLAEIWDDLDIDLRSDLAALATKETEGILISELSDGRVRALEQRGLGAQSGNRMRSGCRLMARYAIQQAPAIADLKRLFGTQDAYHSNIRGLLEHRLVQVDSRGLDKDLRLYVGNAVRDLEPDPDVALKWVRSIASRALTLIWEAELGPGLDLRRDWITEWQHANVNWSEDRGKIPKGYGAQCNILRLVTGTDKVRRLARFATKPTFLLIDYLQSVGDFGQHREDFPESVVTLGYASVVVGAAVELLDCLSRDLARSPA